MTNAVSLRLVEALGGTPIALATPASPLELSRLDMQRLPSVDGPVRLLLEKASPWFTEMLETLLSQDGIESTDQLDPGHWACIDTQVDVRSVIDGLLYDAHAAESGRSSPEAVARQMTDAAIKLVTVWATLAAAQRLRHMQANKVLALVQEVRA